MGRERDGYIWVSLLPVDVSPSLCCPSLKGRVACLATKGLLRGVNHVEEAIFILLLFVDLRNGGGHTDHAVLIDKKKKRLGGVELQSTPDYLYQLTHVNMVGDEELGLVQDRKLLFSLIPLNDHRNFIRMLLSYLLHFLATVSKAPSLFEGSVGWHN